MLRLLADENFNHRILRGLRLRNPSLDILIAQETPLVGARDADVLTWCADQGRVLITHDLKTIPRLAYERVQASQEMPGVLAVPNSLAIGKAIDDLATLVECAGEHDLWNLVIYLPV